MVHYNHQTDRAFAALADPGRREILRRLADRSCTVSELAGPAGMSLTGMKKHLRILEEAGMVATEKRGRSRHCSIDPRGFDEAGFWLDQFKRDRIERYERLDRVILEKQKEKGETRT